MVHHHGVVVTLKDLANGAPFREYNHQRNGNSSYVVVRMPFDTEYGITIKTMDHGRRRFEVAIDGTKIGSFVIDGGPGFQQTLERFLETAKRFKFVKATADGVADPTNPQNGNIEVKVWREKFPEIKTSLYGFCGGSSVLRGAAPRYGDSVPICATKSMEYSAPTLGFFNETGHAGAPASDVGATAEGSTSKQTFEPATWNGDFGEPEIFYFRVLGPGAVGTKVFCTQCGTEAQPDHRFCARCGVVLAGVAV